ncbi:MAG: outer membrane beta-barrel protein [Pseudomonadota bacterium]
MAPHRRERRPAAAWGIKIFCLGVGLALAAAPASAQVEDIAGRWSGCYAGGHVGGLWGEADDWIVETPGGDFFGQSLGGHRLNSFIGGAQGGCDAQFGDIVIGVAAGYSWADADGSHPSRLETGVTYGSEISGSGALTVRAGYAIDSVLGYVRGGFAWQEESYIASTTMIGTAYTADETRTGWTIGIGGAYAITDALSLFLEYDYRDYGTETIDLTPQVAGLGPASVAITSRASLVRAGINLHFGPLFSD